MNAKSKALQERKLKVKSRGSSIGFDKHWKVLQGAAKKYGDIAVHLRGYDTKTRAGERRRKIDPNDIPF